MRHIILILATFLAVPVAFPQYKTVSGMAVIRIDSGQVWYSAVSVAVKEQAPDWIAIALCPEPDFWGRDIDPALRSPIRNIEVKNNAIEIEAWGKLTIYLPPWSSPPLADQSGERAVKIVVTGPAEIPANSIMILIYPTAMAFWF